MCLFSFFHLFCQELLVDSSEHPCSKQVLVNWEQRWSTVIIRQWRRAHGYLVARGLAQLLCVKITDAPGLVIYISSGMAFGVETSVHSLQNCQPFWDLWIRNFSYEDLGGAVYQMAVPGSLPRLHRDGHWSYKPHILIQTAKEELCHKVMLCHTPEFGACERWVRPLIYRLGSKFI